MTAEESAARFDDMVAILGDVARERVESTGSLGSLGDELTAVAAFALEAEYLTTLPAFRIDLPGEAFLTVALSSFDLDLPSGRDEKPDGSFVFLRFFTLYLDIVTNGNIIAFIKTISEGYDAEGRDAFSAYLRTGRIASEARRSGADVLRAAAGGVELVVQLNDLLADQDERYRRFALQAVEFAITPLISPIGPGDDTTWVELIGKSLPIYRRWNRSIPADEGTSYPDWMKSLTESINEIRFAH